MERACLSKDIKTKQTIKELHDAQVSHSMKFSRFIYIRYFVAFIAFSNLYWIGFAYFRLGILMLVPLTMVIASFWMFGQLLRIQSDPEDKVSNLKKYFILNVIVLIFQIILVLISSGYYFPYINANGSNLLILSGMFIFWIAMSILSLRHINNVEGKKDTISKFLYNK